jgi:hypothetical protein
MAKQESNASVAARILLGAGFILLPPEQAL